MASFKTRLTILAISLLTTALLLQSGRASAVSDDLTEVPFEQLLDTEVVTADRIAKQISNAPSAVAVVTAKDIKTYGYRTLAEILNSMRGVSMVRDLNNYWYLSGRGYGNAGNYSGRLSLLIDGYRAQDSLYGQSYFGNDGLLDVDLIERVEYIPGSGSSSYGDAAFLGVVNIITKKGGDIDGAQVALGTGSHDWKSKRATFGKRFDSGLDLLLSGSGMSSDGRQLPDNLTGGALAFEADKNQRLFAKASFKGWTFEAATVDRWLPDARSTIYQSSDISGFARLKYDGLIAEGLHTSVDLYTGQYRYIFEYTDGSWSSTQLADWRGIDAKLVSTLLDDHTLVMGVEYRDDNRQGVADTSGGTTNYLWLTNRQTQSIYAYDDIALADNLRLSLGGRHDARKNGTSTFSPRGALIYSPREESVLKLSTGIAHRQATATEEPNLTVPVNETVKTRELVWEQSFGPNTRLISSLYNYQIGDYIGGPINTWRTPATLDANGFEVELEKRWDSGTRLQASYSRQSTKDQKGNTPANVARDLAKLNLAEPFSLVGLPIEAGLGLRYIGTRPDRVAIIQPSALIGDLTLSTRWHDLSALLSVRNIGQANYDHVSNSFGRGGLYPEDKNDFWFQLQYDFR